MSGGGAPWPPIDLDRLGFRRWMLLHAIEIDKYDGHLSRLKAERDYRYGRFSRGTTEWFGLAAAARHASVSPSTLRRMIDDAELAAYRIEGSVRIRAADLRVAMATLQRTGEERLGGYAEMLTGRNREDLTNSDGALRVADTPPDITVGWAPLASSNLAIGWRPVTLVSRLAIDVHPGLPLESYLNAVTDGAAWHVVRSECITVRWRPPNDVLISYDLFLATLDEFHQVVRHLIDGVAGPTDD